MCGKLSSLGNINLHKNWHFGRNITPLMLLDKNKIEEQRKNKGALFQFFLGLNSGIFFKTHCIYTVNVSLLEQWCTV